MGAGVFGDVRVVVAAHEDAVALGGHGVIDVVLVLVVGAFGGFDEHVGVAGGLDTFEVHVCAVGVLPGGNVDTVGHVVVGDIGLYGDRHGFRQADGVGGAVIVSGGVGVGGSEGEVSQAEAGGEGCYQEGGGESEGS